MDLAELRHAVQHLLPESPDSSWWLRRHGQTVEIVRVGGPVNDVLMAHAVMASPAIDTWFAHHTAGEVDGWRWMYSTDEPADGVPVHGDWDSFIERLATVTTTIPVMPTNDTLLPTRPQQAAAGALSVLRFGARLLERLIGLLERRGW